MVQDKRRDWREICEEVLQEADQARLNVLLQELLEVLEDREALAQPRSIDVVARVTGRVCRRRRGYSRGTTHTSGRFRYFSA
jgi:hypothetical protein